jgi:hypothetical protein
VNHDANQEGKMQDEFTAQVKKKYDDIEKKEAEARQKLEVLAAEKAPLKAYLIKAGVMNAQKRNRKAKPASTGSA